MPPSKSSEDGLLAFNYKAAYLPESEQDLGLLPCHLQASPGSMAGYLSFCFCPALPHCLSLLLYFWPWPKTTWGEKSLQLPVHHEGEPGRESGGRK